MLSKYQVRYILRCLDAAQRLAPQADPGQADELAWNIRQAREAILDAAVAPIAIDTFKQEGFA